MKIKKQKVIYVALKQELYRKSHYERLWMASRNLPIGGRRKLLDAISLAVMKFVNNGGKILNPDGSDYAMPELDDLFPDQDMRWLSYYLEADDSDDSPRRISRKWQRLQVIYLLFQISYPKIAEIIAK